MRSVLPKKARLVPKGAKRVFSGVIFDVYQWRQKMFDGSYETFEMLKRPDTVKAVCIKDDKIILIEETNPDGFNYYALPGGRHDNESEDELQAAKREILEETGMTFSNWNLLDAFQPSDQVEQIVYLFLAFDFQSQSEQRLDSGEKIEVLELSLDELKELCKDPRARYLPEELIGQMESVDDLFKLKEFKGE